MADENQIPILAEIGSSGLKHHSGYLEEEFHRDLQGTRAVDVYNEMEQNSSVVGAFTYAMEMLIRQVDWKMNPANDTVKAKSEAEFVDGCRSDMDSTWDELISEIMSFVVFGWSPFEEVFKIRKGFNPQIPQLNSKFDDGRVGWRNIAIRAQSSLVNWDIDDKGRIRGMNQRTPQDFKENYIPVEKMLLFRTRVRKNNPEGRSLLRSAYRSWYYTKRLQEIEGIGAERDLAGMPVMEAPPAIMHPNASPQQKAIRSQLEDQVRKVKKDELMGMVIPSEMDPGSGKPTGYRFRLLTTSGRNPVDINEIIKRHESRTLISVLAEFLVLGLDKVGSFALSSDKTDLMVLALGALIGAIEDVFNRYAIPRLMALNYVDRSLWPELGHGDIETPSLSELATFLTAATGTGVIVPDEGLEIWAREQASMPVKDPGAPAPGLPQDMSGFGLDATPQETEILSSIYDDDEKKEKGTNGSNTTGTFTV